ncbi:hypothetical protein AAG906_038403 [Vitis piasezkii]
MEAFEKLKQLGRYDTSNSIRNAYAMGKVKMIAFEFETTTRTCGMLNLQLRVARFMLVAMASLFGGTHPSWERILKRALLGHCVEFFRALIQGPLLVYMFCLTTLAKMGLLIHMEGSHFTRLEKMVVAITNLIVQY